MKSSLSEERSKLYLHYVVYSLQSSSQAMASLFSIPLQSELPLPPQTLSDKGTGREGSERRTSLIFAITLHLTYEIRYSHTDYFVIGLI